ncbi:putative membrane protein [Ochrobactrum quorumnocens]|uniref:Putative membrane protein n=1 Tax=Ochrobactrum quorumnocens TaxID=271865 RepID=A0A248UD40_9HYPH|nr:putative membrane protein [[Ochrobactrum] quorumnocens]
MGQGNSMNDNDAILASVYTRWHQLAAPFALITSVGCFLLVTLNHGPFILAGVFALLALALLHGGQ